MFVIMAFCCSTICFAEDWNNGVGQITELSAFPNYLVVTQGGVSTGPASCNNTNRWVLDWTQIDPAAASRIYSLLLVAYTTKTSFLAVLDSSVCGPEGYKKANGKFYFPPS